MNARRSSASQFDFSQPHVLRRNDIRPLHGAMINGIWRGAGAVYPVRAPEKTSGPDIWSEVLQPGWSISWTTLPNHEILDSHYHPVISYVAIVKGRAQLIGQQTGFVDAGSIIRIPAWHLHGFKTVPGQEPFWAITWQPLQNSLFTGEDPNVLYAGDEGAPAEPDPRIHAEIVQSRVKPFADKKLPAAPKFEFLDLSIEKKRQLQIAGRAILFCVSGRVSVTTSANTYEIKEGDMVPFAAQASLDSVESITCSQSEAGSALALMTF